MADKQDQRPDKSFHFDVGDSSTGPIGFCARVVAKDKRGALKRLRELLPDEQPGDAQGELDAPEEYIQIYINDRAIKTTDIDDWEIVEKEIEEPGDGP